MTPHFTHHLSRVLGEMGIKSLETGTYWQKYPNEDSEWEIHSGDWLDEDRPFLSAYRLDDILTLMPEIKKAMDWDKPIWDCRKIYPKATCESMFCEYAGWKSIRQLSHELLDAFLEGGYPAAEAYLMSITEGK